MSWLTGNIETAMLHGSKVTAERYAELLPLYIRQASRDRPRYRSSTSFRESRGQRRHFHDYFVTHLPSSSLHPDSRSPAANLHKLPAKASTPHTSQGRSPPSSHPSVSRDTTVVRIPLKSAKHHYGACVSRGSRPYNEDSHQAGIIELPAFAKRPPKSVSVGKSGESTAADGLGGDPQVFYFGVFDGHGGAECSGYLKEQLHAYLERAANDFQLESSLQTGSRKSEPVPIMPGDSKSAQKALRDVRTAAAKDVPDGLAAGHQDDEKPPKFDGAAPIVQEANQEKIQNLEKSLVQDWKKLVGGYFRRFKPAYFSIYGSNTEGDKDPNSDTQSGTAKGAVIEEVITYAFLKADYDFVSTQVAREAQAQDSVRADRALNEDDHIIGSPRPKSTHSDKQKLFKGGSTCSIAVVSTPTPAPFWNPSSTSSLLVAHVGDTRVIVCSTATGVAVPLTTDHHPSSPIEATRLRRYAATFVTDSFGEERILGMANTRAFGDIGSKRIGVSAEPEIKRIELGAAEFSFMVLISDGVSGTLSDQEIVDIVKEAKTPEQGARDVVGFATEVTTEGDNATCLVVRLGGWERRQEGGYGSLGTKESRDFKRQDALDPRNRTR